MNANRTVKALALGAALAVAAVLLGFGAMWVVIGIANAILPPFQIADDDTLRERSPVAIAYLTWAVTTVIVLVAGLRAIRRRR